VSDADVIDARGFHHQAIEADDAKEPQAQLVRAGAIVGVDQHELWHGTGDRAVSLGGMPEAQQVLRVFALALEARAALLGADRQEALGHEAFDDMHGGEETVTLGHGMPGLLSKDARSYGTDLLKGHGTHRTVPFLQNALCAYPERHPASREHHLHNLGDALTFDVFENGFLNFQGELAAFVPLLALLGG
jgi:hypothetical protein